MSTSQPIVLLLLALPALGQIPGRNVNMVSGIAWPAGDPFLQRQNEPSLAVSSRNPSHLLAGSNDYRTVDLPGSPGAETGDAWLGVFKSYDGGQSWRSTVHPGCAQKIAACDGAPLLKSYTAGADPVVRTATNGLFYFSGIAFTRDTPMKSVVFVSRFIDNNNEENGDPIKYVDTIPVATGNNTVFVDKPWLAVDIPRPGAGTCTITVPGANGNPLVQKFPAGNAYIAYTTFTDETKPPSQIVFSRTTDCGATWSKPYVVANGALNQGASLAVDPNTGAVYMAWRRFQSPGIADAVMFAQSSDGGLTFSGPLQVATISPFDQGTTDFSFRTNAYPTMAVDGSSRIYLAWSERQQGATASDGDARIVIATSRNGTQWTARTPVSDYPGRGHQFMPAMTFGGGKLMVLFYDLRLDSTVGNYTSLGGGQYLEARAPAGDLATTPPHPEKVFTDYVLDAAPASLNLGGLLRRHTLDVFSAQADPADVPSFSAARISQYIFGSRAGSKLIEQLQINPPNLPLFKQGSVPFMGDYLDVAAWPSFLPGDVPGTWKFNTDPSRAIAFHAVWTDNRDVRPPANGDWTDYTPPISASSSGVSIFDPTQPQPACRTGQTGMRNQNIYTARITQGLLVTSPSDAKTLGTLQRAFPIVVTNSTTRTRTYRLIVLNQPKGGKASFLEVPVAGLPDPLIALDVNVAPGSSISRMVFVRSTDPMATIRVDVDEIAAVGATQLLSGGLQGSLVLNPDPLNPDNPDLTTNELFNPDIANPDIANPDIANGAISDATWRLTNQGNTTATYSVQFLLTGATLPPVVKTQLVIHRVYATPVSVGCSLVEQPQLVVAANIANPALLTPRTASKLRALIVARRRPRHGRPTLDSADSVTDITDNSLDNATVSVGPGETIYITLRFVNPDKTTPLPFDIGQAITAVSISHAINTGETQPRVAASHLFVATTALPAGGAGSAYDEFLAAAGGKQPYHWTIVRGALPPGLSLSLAGEISGTIASSARTYNFGVQVSDSSNPAKSLTQDLSIRVSGVALAIVDLAASGPAGANVKLGDTITVTATVSNSGSAADSVILDLNLLPGGTASADCSGPTPATASLPKGARQTFTFTCTMVTGNGTLAFAVGITAVDHTSDAGLSIGPSTSNTVTVLNQPPAIAVSATAGSAAYASGTWTSSDVVVTFTCTPATGHPIVKIVTVNSEGANQTVSDTCTDLAGNQASGSFSGIDIDKTPPRISSLSLPPANAYGWYNTDVTTTWTCSDALSGPRQANGSSTVSSEGANQVVTATCTDQAGNTASSAGGTVSIDKTPPGITAQVSPPAPANGWYHGAVTVAFNCTDSLSGVAPGYPRGDTTLIGDTPGTVVGGTCRDQAGNSASATAGPIRIDNTPPVLQLQSISPATAAVGWSNGPVTVTWTCTDAVSGPVTPIVTRTLTASGSATATCSDNAGNSASATQTGIRIDTVPPSVTIVSPVNGSTYHQGAHVIANFSCQDADSGIAFCTGTVASGQPLPLDTLGPHSFTVTAVDKAGNQTVVTRTYTVVAGDGE